MSRQSSYIVTNAPTDDPSVYAGVRRSIQLNSIAIFPPEAQASSPRSNPASRAASPRGYPHPLVKVDSSASIRSDSSHATPTNANRTRRHKSVDRESISGIFGLACTSPPTPGSPVGGPLLSPTTSGRNLAQQLQPPHRTSLTYRPSRLSVGSAAGAATSAMLMNPQDGAASPSFQARNLGMRATGIEALAAAAAVAAVAAPLPVVSLPSAEKDGGSGRLGMEAFPEERAGSEGCAFFRCLSGAFLKRPEKKKRRSSQVQIERRSIVALRRQDRFQDQRTVAKTMSTYAYAYAIHNHPNGQVAPNFSILGVAEAPLALGSEDATLTRHPKDICTRARESRRSSSGTPYVVAI